MKCPFCNSELDVMKSISDSVLGCPKCRHIATRGLWESLDIAIESLNDIANLSEDSTVYNSEQFRWAKAYAKSALEQIKQKD